jgi:ferredoxin
VVPIRFPERRAHEDDVTQWPQPFVREAVVVAVLLLVAEPEAPQGVARRRRRDSNAVAQIDDVAVRASAAVCDPCAAACPHDRLDRRDEAAGGDLQLDPVRGRIVDIRLPVGHHDDFRTGQLVCERLPQRVGAPIDLGGIDRASRLVELAQQEARPPAEHRRIDVDEPAISPGFRLLEGATRQLQPSPYHQQGDDRCERCPDERDAGKRDDDPNSRLLTTLLGERQIVQQNEMPAGISYGDRERPHNQPSVIRNEGRKAAACGPRRLLAGEGRGHQLAVKAEPAFLVAEPYRVETLVECEASEQIVDARPRVDRQKIGQLIAHRVEDERRAQLDVAARPLLDEGAGKRRDRDDRRSKQHERDCPITNYHSHGGPRRSAPLAATTHSILSDWAIRALSAFTIKA